MLVYVDKKLPLKIKSEKKYYIPMSIYILFLIISTVTSNYMSISVGGFADLYQGMYVLMSYIFITFFTINYVNNEHDVKLFTNAFTILVIVEGTLGLFQYFGLDYLKSNLFLNFIIPSNVEIESITNVFGKYEIYGTMYNTNFVGSFATIILPLTLATLVTAKTKKIKVINAIAFFLAICLWIGCNSRAGYMGLIVVISFSCILLRKEIVRNYKFTLGIVILALSTILIFNTVSDGRILGQLSRLNIFKEIEQIEQIDKNSQTEDSNVVFKDIILTNNSFMIVTNKESLQVEFENGGIMAYDNELKKLELIFNDENYLINDDRFKNYNIVILSENNVGINVYGRYIDFYMTENGIKIVGSGNRLTEPIVADKLKILDGYDRFASGRGYIWSRTIKMLPNVILKGYGPDTYPVVFPQDDFIAKLNAGMDASMIVDKPHNMYLQIAINTGLISLLALLTLWGIYLITSLKLYKGMIYDTAEKCIGFACFMAVLGYLVAGIFNDQIVSVAPLFWITLGLGISINERLKYKNKA